MKIKIKRIATKIKVPVVPNFVKTESKIFFLIDVAEFTDAELKKIGKEWTKALIINANKRKKK